MPVRLGLVYFTVMADQFAEDMYVVAHSDDNDQEIRLRTQFLLQELLAELVRCRASYIQVHRSAMLPDDADPWEPSDAG